MRPPMPPPTWMPPGKLPPLRPNPPPLLRPPDSTCEVSSWTFSLKDMHPSSHVGGTDRQVTTTP